MKLRKILLGSITATLAASPIVTNAATTTTMNSISSTINEVQEEIDNYDTSNLLGSFATDGCKYTTVETRAYDGWGDEENQFIGGIPFTKTHFGYNGGRNGYNKPTFNNQNNTLVFDTNGHNNIYHLIAQKIRVDITVPANQAEYNVQTEVNGNITTYAHGASCGFRVRHSLELFDLGDDESNNPEFFNDTFHPNTKVDKYHVSEKQIWHKRDVAGGDTHHDTFNSAIVYKLHNPTSEPIVVSKYFMVAMTTNGDLNKFGDIGSTSSFNFKTYRRGECQAENEIIAFENMLEKNLQDTINDEHFDVNRFYNEVWVYVQTKTHDPSIEGARKACHEYWINKFKNGVKNMNDRYPELVDKIFTDKDGNKISIDDSAVKYADSIINDNQKFIKDTRENNKKQVEQFTKERQKRLLGWETLEISSNGINKGYEIRDNEPAIISYDSLKEYPTHKHPEDIWGCIGTKNNIFVTSDEARSARLVYIPFKLDFTIPASENTVLTYKPSFSGTFKYYSTLKNFKRPNNTFSFEMFYFGEGDQAKDLKPNKLSFAKCGEEHDEHTIWQGVFKTDCSKGGNYAKNVDISSRDCTITIDNTQGNNIHKSFYFGLAVSLDSINGNDKGLSRFDLNLKPQFLRGNSFIQTTADSEKSSNDKTNPTPLPDLGAKAKCAQRLRETDTYKDYKLSDMNLKMSDIERKVGYDYNNSNPSAPSSVVVHSTDRGDNDGRAYYLPISIPLTVPAHTKTKFEIKLSEVFTNAFREGFIPTGFIIKTTTSLFDYGISEKLGTDEMPEKLPNYYTPKENLSEHDQKTLAYFNTTTKDISSNIMWLILPILAAIVTTIFIFVSIYESWAMIEKIVTILLDLCFVAWAIISGVLHCDYCTIHLDDEYFQERKKDKPSKEIIQDFEKSSHYKYLRCLNFTNILNKTVELSNISDESKTYYLNLGYGFVHCGTAGNKNDNFCENYIYSDVQILSTEKTLS